MFFYKIFKRIEKTGLLRKKIFLKVQEESKVKISLLTDKSDGKSLCSETNFDLSRMKVDFAVLQSLKRERKCLFMLSLFLLFSFDAKSSQVFSAK